MNIIIFFFFSFVFDIRSFMRICTQLNIRGLLLFFLSLSNIVLFYFLLLNKEKNDIELKKTFLLFYSYILILFYFFTLH